MEAPLVVGGVENQARQAAKQVRAIVEWQFDSVPDGPCPAVNPNRSLEKVSCHFLMTAIRKIALYMLDS